ncbi:MAG TPA: GNAT family N-acetyltransferase, partial [Aquihabitans sp.]|nr:GNAT family N-acetyltransferase [Aquihabitans sp.]
MDIIRGDASHEDAILALAARTLGWTDDPRFRALYRWKHERSPFGASPRWVAVEDGEVVGFRVLLPWRFERGDGTVVRAVRAVDTATDPAHQGRGIFRRLTTAAVEELRAEGVDFVFNTPNDQSRPGYLKMGWIELGRPPVAVVPRGRSLPRIARSRAAAELWSVPSTVGRAAGPFFEEVDAADLVGPHHRAGTWRTERTPSFLAWRYGLAELGYRVLTVDDLRPAARRGPGAVVFRLRRRGPSTEATIADVLAPRPDVRRSLVRAVVRETGADYGLVAGGRRVGPTPAVVVASLGPLVTWRALARRDEPTMSSFELSVGDL